MKEKLPFGERPPIEVVGTATEEIKEEIRSEISERFGERHLDQIPPEKLKILEKAEKEKELYEKRAIELINLKLGELRSEFGLQAFDIPERNIHVVPQDLYREADSKGRIATTFTDTQLIAINADKTANPFDRVSTTLHEMTHLAGYLAIEAFGKSDKPYRTGLRAFATNKKSKEIGPVNYFWGLNEAVVAEIEKKYTQEIISENEFLSEDADFQNSEKIKEQKRKIAERAKIDQDEIIWVDENGKDGSFFSYYRQRQVLYYMVDAIYERNEDEFDSKDDVMKEFFRAHFTGNLLPIARLVENAFGKGSFRVVGMMTEDRNSASMLLDYLKHHKKSEE